MANINFKNSELGPIPNDWDVKALGEIAEVKTGPFGSALHAEDYVMDGTPIITVEHIEHIKIDVTKGVPKVSEIDFKRLCAYTLKSGDLVFSRVGSVDRCSYVSDNENNWLFSGRLLRVRLNDNINPIYLAYHLNTEKAKQRVLSVAVGLAMPSINTKILSGIRVILPPLPEQRRIAAALSDIDALIDNLDALIDKKRLIKQATMQQLLSGKKRINGFNDKWVMKKLGDCCEIYRGGSPRPIEAYLTNIGINWIKIGDVSANSKYITQTEEKITEVGAKHSRFVHKGDFILSNSMSFGRPYILQIDGCIHDGWLVIQNYQTNFETDFLYYLLGSDIVFMQYIGMAAGSSVQNLNKEKVANVYLNVPPTLAEQTAISKILSDMDEEISLLEAKKEKYTAIKQGMMQQLLSGRVRLK